MKLESLTALFPAFLQLLRAIWRLRDCQRDGAVPAMFPLTDVITVLDNNGQGRGRVTLYIYHEKLVAWFGSAAVFDD